MPDTPAQPADQWPLPHQPGRIRRVDTRQPVNATRRAVEAASLTERFMEEMTSRGDD